MARRAAILVLAAASLCGCLAKGPGPDSCGAEGMQDLVGKDRSALASMTVPAGTRTIEPGMAVTEDYNPGRLNIDLDSGGRITAVWCG